MRAGEIVAAILASQLAISAPARATPPEILVLIQSATATSAKPGQVAVSFSPSMLVRVIERRASSALVQRLYDDERIGWVHLASLGKLGAFKPMGAWHGQSNAIVNSESGDSQRTYQLHPNGTFRSIHSDASASQLHESGLLLRQGATVWARPTGVPSGEPDTWEFFWLLPGGKLCHLTDAGACASQ